MDIERRAQFLSERHQAGREGHRQGPDHGRISAGFGALFDLKAAGLYRSRPFVAGDRRGRHPSFRIAIDPPGASDAIGIDFRRDLRERSRLPGAPSRFPSSTYFDSRDSSRCDEHGEHPDDHRRHRRGLFKRANLRADSACETAEIPGMYAPRLRPRRFRGVGAMERGGALPAGRRRRRCPAGAGLVRVSLQRATSLVRKLRSRRRALRGGPIPGTLGRFGPDGCAVMSFSSPSQRSIRPPRRFDAVRAGPAVHALRPFHRRRAHRKLPARPPRESRAPEIRPSRVVRNDPGIFASAQEDAAGASPARRCWKTFNCASASVLVVRTPGGPMNLLAAYRQAAGRAVAGRPSFCRVTMGVRYTGSPSE